MSKLRYGVPGFECKGVVLAKVVAVPYYSENENETVRE